MVQTDVVVIGAGLLGCFTARNLRRYDVGVTVIEKEKDVCRGISKANTGIIYPGYDSKPRTEKTRLCTQANKDFDKLCEELDVRFNRPGSLMVGYGPKAEAVILKKYENGISGGIEGLKLLDDARARALEPSLAPGIRIALFSQTTGTVNPWELGIAAYENARDNGASFDFGREVKGISRSGAEIIVETENEKYCAKAVVNAAGLSSDCIRELLEEPSLRLVPTAADYIVLDRRMRDSQDNVNIKRIIFHEAENGKGLTIVPTVDGSMLLGPTNREIEESSDDENIRSCDYSVSEEGISEIKNLCAKLVPSLELDKQIRTFGSMRPNVRDVRTDESMHDFNVLEDNGLISLIGIKTPGLTFSNEIGKLVTTKIVKRLTELGQKVETRTDFNPCRKGITRVAELELETRAKLISENPAYGEIVCECMDVSKGEIIEAIARGASDYEGIRRRTGIGMGSCQGSRCHKKVMDIIGGKDNEKKA